MMLKRVGVGERWLLSPWFGVTNALGSARARARASREPVSSLSASYRDVAKLIDHALLSPALDANELEAGLALARAYDVASVCILPYYVERAAAVLAGSDVKVTTTIGFPHGAQTSGVKRFEAERAIVEGAVELDMVVNVSRVKSGAYALVRDEIAAICELCHANARKLKVIFENAYLTDTKKHRLCEISSELRVDWVKTSTGFGPSGATLADVELMRHACPESVQVKASGGVRNIDTLLAFRPFVTRIGTSSTRAILDEFRERHGLAAVAL